MLQTIKKKKKKKRSCIKKTKKFFSPLSSLSLIFIYNSNSFVSCIITLHAIRLVLIGSFIKNFSFVCLDSIQIQVLFTLIFLRCIISLCKSFYKRKILLVSLSFYFLPFNPRTQFNNNNNNPSNNLFNFLLVFHLKLFTLGSLSIKNSNFMQFKENPLLISR